MKNILPYILILFISISCSNSRTQTKKENETKINTVKTIDETQPKKKQNDIKEELTDSASGFNYDYKTYNIEKQIYYYYNSIETSGNTIRIDRDYIEYDSVLINGKIPFRITLKNLINIIGEPDSIVEYLSEIYDCSAKRYHFANMIFNQNDYDSLARIESLKFQDDIYILYNEVEFNANSDLISFKDMFPLSYINSTNENTGLNLKKNNIIINSLRFSTTGKQYTDDIFICSFENERLMNLWYWEPT